MLVIVGRACFSEVLQDPRTLVAGFDIAFWRCAGQLTELAESNVWTRPATEKYWGIGIGLVWAKTLQVEPNSAVQTAVSVAC